MTRGQLIVTILISIWVWILAGVLLVAIGPEGLETLVPPSSETGIWALIASAPVCAGLMIWVWLGDRNRKPIVFAPLVGAPLLLAAIVSGVTQNLWESGLSRTDETCGWARYRVGDGLEGEAMKHVLASEGDSVWFEGLDFYAPNLNSGVNTAFSVRGTVRNGSSSNIQLQSYYLGFLNDESEVIAEQTGGMTAVGFQLPFLRPGYLHDFSVSAQRNLVPSVARRDTASFAIYYCQVR